jgi:hypothetical protein
MTGKTIMSSTRCQICNCLSHATAYCNSNMKGRRKMLEEMEDCMMADKMPEFNSFPIDELKFVISRMRLNDNPRIVFPRKQFTSGEIKQLRSQIPLTLPKTRMVRELVKRWNLYGRIRIVKSATPEDGDDCPICMDCMETPTWNHIQLRWDMVSAKTQSHDAMFPNNIKTRCGHTFCGSCWEIHYRTNRKYEYGRISSPYLECPLCRHKMCVSHRHDSS